MPCQQCPDGHWECGGNLDDLCGLAEEWIELGEMTCDGGFYVYAKNGPDGKPLVWIEPKFQLMPRDRAVVQRQEHFHRMFSEWFKKLPTPQNPDG